MKISDVDVTLDLSNDDGDAGQSTQPVTLHLTIAVSTNVASPIFSNNPTEMPTIRDGSPAEEATKPLVVLVSGAPSRPTACEPPLPSPDTLPTETGAPMPDSQAETSPAEKVLVAVRRADEAKKRIDRENTWEGAISRIKWVMDTVGPIAEVCTISILPLLD